MLIKIDAIKDKKLKPVECGSITSLRYIRLEQEVTKFWNYWHTILDFEILV